MGLVLLSLFTLASESAPLSGDRSHGRQHLSSYAMQSKQPGETLNLPHCLSPKVPKTHLSGVPLPGFIIHEQDHHVDGVVPGGYPKPISVTTQSDK